MVDIVNAEEARRIGGVKGRGITVAVLDSGCFPSHVAFSENRILPGKNFTNVGGAYDTRDTRGHGTAVSGIIAGNTIAPIIAPQAKILPLKIIPDGAATDPIQSDFTFMSNALSWLLGNEGRASGASVVCLSQGDRGNYRTVEEALTVGIKREIAEKIRNLRRLNIATVVAAGNSYFFSDDCSANSAGRSQTGMCFPAIMPECISVGAVFLDSTMHGHTFAEYGCAWVRLSLANQVTPFSQRLPKSPANRCFTRLFAPGAPIMSLGNTHPAAQWGPLYGTSIATPIVAGVIALLQERYQQDYNCRLPPCDDLERWLLEGARPIVDSDDGRDNVAHTGAAFRVVDALGAMRKLMAGPPLNS